MGAAERKIEEYLVRQVRDVLGGIAYKFVSPARRNVPDRLCTLPTGLTVFVECKSPQGYISAGQQKEIERLTNLGQYVIVVSSKSEVDEFIDVFAKLIKLRKEKGYGKL